MELTLDTCLYFISDLNPKIIRKTKNDRVFVGVKQFFAGMEMEDQIPIDFHDEKVKKNRRGRPICILPDGKNSGIIGRYYRRK